MALKVVLKKRFVIILVMVIIVSSLSADENLWSTNGPFGGSVKTIAIHPFNPETIYVGTIVNGIYKTNDGANNWQHIDSDALYPTMRVIVFHPLEPDTIYAATAGGVFKSPDAGENWEQISPPACWDSELRTLLIHPTDPQIIITGGPMNEWITFDNGHTWNRPGIPNNIGISSIAVDRNNPDIIYVAASSFSYGLGLWKSDDRGLLWQNIQNNIDSAGFGADIEIDPIDSDIIYLARINIYEADNDSCLSKTIDGGQNWFDITPDDLTKAEILCVKVLPADHNTVFICTKNDGVLKSTDGGENWQRVNSGLKVNQTAALEFEVINGIIYLGTYHDGIYKSIDEGNTWQKISDNISCVETWDLAVSDFNPDFALVAARNGVYSTENFGQSWSYVDLNCPLEHSIATVCLDNYNPDYIYGASVHSSNNSQLSTGFFRSTDGGDTWFFFNEGLPGNNHYVEIVISYINEDDRRIFLCSAHGLYYSDNRGASWNICMNGLPTDAYYVVAEAAPNNPNIIAVGDAIDRIFISQDRGESWNQAGRLPEHPRSEYINDIEFDPNHADHIFVCSYYQGLFESHDGGDTWTNINNNLQVDPDITVVSGITINPQNPLNMFVASNHYGVFQTHDGGQSWESFNAGLDTTDGVGDMMFAVGDTSRLYFATSMRSVWSITRTGTSIDDEDALLPTQFTAYNYPNPFNASTNISFSLPQAADVRLDIYDMLGRRVSSLVNEYMFAGYHTVVWRPDNLGSGVYIYLIKAGEFDISQKVTLLK